MKPHRLWIPLALTTAAGAIAIWIVSRLVLPWQGSRDLTRVTAQEMAQLALASVQYIQALCSAAFAGAVIAISQRLSGSFQLIREPRRGQLIGFGLAALALSLASGFVNIEMIIEAADQGLVQEKLAPLRLLRVLQSLFLLAGVVMVAAALVWDSLIGPQEVA